MQEVAAGNVGGDPNLFREAQEEEEAKEKQRQFDRQIALLIGAKNYERLRAFGYEVKKVAHHLAPITEDRRSLES